MVYYACFEMILKLKQTFLDNINHFEDRFRGSEGTVNESWIY